jgi:hypothetical protein
VHRTFLERGDPEGAARSAFRLAVELQLRGHRSRIRLVREGPAHPRRGAGVRGETPGRHR